MGKLIYTINDRGYVAIIEKASYNTSVGVLDATSPLVLCLRDDLLCYYPPLSELPEETPIIDVRNSLQAHIDEGLLSSDVLDLLPITS
jgi:hypothetical protein